MSTLKATGSTWAWRKLRAEILERDGHRCHWCGGEANTVDHLLPRAAGGGDGHENLVAACGRCNSSRGARMGRTATQGPSRGW